MCLNNEYEGYSVYCDFTGKEHEIIAYIDWENHNDSILANLFDWDIVGAEQLSPEELFEVNKQVRKDRDQIQNDIEFEELTKATERAMEDMVS